jgi:23S rRNA (pseudouridine1915-N3)-methyltransferase
MKKINILSVGKTKKEYIPLEEELLKKITNYASLTLTSLDSTKDIGKMKENEIQKYIDVESNLLIQKLDNSYKVLLDVQANPLDSYEFAEILKRDNLQFIVGGAYGINDLLRGKVDARISLSKLTFNHLLARLVLLEQIYRGSTINNNGHYHK